MYEPYASVRFRPLCEASHKGRYVEFPVMCTKRRKSLETLGLGDAQVNTNKIKVLVILSLPQLGQLLTTTANAFNIG